MVKEQPVFRPSFGNRPDRLIGRERVIQTIMDGLQSYTGSSGRTSLIVGQRGMGKTAVLLEIAEQAKEYDYIPVRTTCGPNMTDNIIEMLQRDGSAFIDEENAAVKGFNAGALGFSFGLTFSESAQKSFGFRVKLEMICEKLSRAGKRVLILVDEVNPAVTEMRELATTYQELIGNDIDISIVMAGLPSAVSDLLNYKTLTFLNRAQKIELSLVPILEVEMYYQSAFERASINADTEFTKSAAEATNGFPYQIQLIGYYLSKMTENGKPVDADILARAEAAATAEIENKVLQPMLNPVSELDLEILICMAKCENGIKISEIQKQLNVTHGTMQTYRRRLIDAGLIHSTRRGEVEFTLPQLADYLRKTK